MQEQTSDQIRTYYICRLMHDFKSTRSSDMYNAELAKGLRQYKETEEGRAEMSDIVSNIYKEYGKEMRKEGEKCGEMKTRVSAVQSLMETMKLSADQALDALKIQGKERESIIKAVQG